MVIWSIPALFTDPGVAGENIVAAVLKDQHVVVLLAPHAVS